MTLYANRWPGTHCDPIVNATWHFNYLIPDTVQSPAAVDIWPLPYAVVE